MSAPDRAPARLRDAVAVATTLLVPLVLYRRAVFLGEVFFDRDINSAWVAQVTAFVNVVASGSAPLWNPWVSFGQPMWAYPTQVPYPWYWLNLLVMPWTFYTASVVAHAAWAILGMFGLGRRLGISRAGCALMAAAWVGCGPVVSTTDMLNLYVGTAWLPWILLTCEMALESGRPLHAALCGSTLAAPILAGSEVGIMGGALFSAWVLARVQWRRLAGPENLRTIRVALVTVVTALLIAAAQWLPTIELMRRSARRALPHDLRVQWSVHPLALLQIALPAFTFDLPLRAGGALFDEMQGPFLASIHLGIPLLALVAAGMLARDQPRARLLGVLAAVSVAIGLGRYFVAYDVVAALPLLSGIRFPVKALILGAFCACVLAGYGVDVWRERERDRRWTAVVVLPAMVLTALGVLVLVIVRVLADRWAPLVLVQTPDRSYADALRPHVMPLLLAVASGALTVALARFRVPSARARSAWAVSACAVVALVAAHHAMVPTARPALYTSRPPLLGYVRPGARLYWRGPRAGWDGPTRGIFFSRGIAPPSIPAQVAPAVAQRQYLWPDMTPEWRLSGSYEADGKGIQAPFARDMFGYLDANDPSPLTLRLLQVGAVEYVVTVDPRGTQALRPVVTLPDVYGDPVHLYAVPDPLPRLYVVGGGRIADGRAAIDALASPGFDPRAEVLLADGEPRAAPPSFQGTARVVSARGRTLVVETDASAPGWLVDVEAYDPNWHAAVDGHPSPVRRANLGFRAIGVGAGRHTVVLTYEPWSVRLGLALSIAGAVVLMTLAVRGMPLRRHAPPPSSDGVR